MTSDTMVRRTGRHHGYCSMLAQDMKRHYILYIMVLPVVAYYVLFCYAPMYGLQIAFRDYSVGLGYLGSKWVGLKHFRAFVSSFYFNRVVRNTLLINVYGLIFAFPAPIIFALLLNEIKRVPFKRTIQTLSYLPYFISMVVICGMLLDFCLSDGLINDVIELLGGERQALLQKNQYFRTIYIASGIWQHLGWNSIIYIAALASIDMEIYQAALIDGAGRFKQAWHITLPGLRPTIIILFILNMGSMFSVSSEKIILLYNAAIYEVSDVISSYVYRVGLQKLNFSFGSAVGLFNSVINFLLVLITNQICRRVSETSLW